MQRRDVVNTGCQVGSQSPSQFSREYGRLYGLPALKDIQRLRLARDGRRHRHVIIRAMFKLMKRQQLHFWIASLALLFNALAPSISYAMTARHGAAPLLEICTASGSRLVDPALPPGDDGPAQALLHHLQHCQSCLSHAGAFGPPPVPVSPLPVPDGHDVFPPLFYLAPSVLFSWTGAQPRGPPVHS